MNNKG
jgi:hypothetical protein